MNSGLWVWPSTPRAQKKVVGKVASSPHLMAGIAAITKSKEGLSNSELDYALGDNSEWMTLGVIRQLTSLGFIEFKTDLFGCPAKYQITDLGRSVLSTITGQPPPPKPVAPAPPPSVQIAPPQAAPAPKPA